MKLSTHVALLLLSLWCLPAVSLQADEPQSLGTPPSTEGQAQLLGLPDSEGPLSVTATFQVMDINEVNDEEETFEFSGILRLTWLDERLAFDPATEGVSEKIYQGPFQVDEVSPAWSPQVLLANSSGMFEVSAVLLRVKPDGVCTLVQSINAVAEVNLNLRRYPFDRQRLEAIFEIFGFEASEVMLKVDPISMQADGREIEIPQWTLRDIQSSTREIEAPYLGGPSTSSAFVLAIDIERQSFFMLRLVVIPLVLIVLLSFSVFWMDRSTLGDRMSVSFVGILTAVAYQIVVGDIFPQISYLTLMNSFLSMSFLVLCATVVVNLVVGSWDKSGQVERGHWLDLRCRQLFPIVYFGLLGLSTAIMYLFF